MFKRMGMILVLGLSVLVLTAATFAQGRKMGLFVGINEYQDGINQLKSCVNDAVNMQNKLVSRYGFAKSNTTLLTDDQATRQGIIKYLTYYEAQLSKGDVFVFYYSGHGSVFPDAYSPVEDETEQFGMSGYFPTGYYDSAIVPVDARQETSGKAWKNLILDDELNEIFSRFTAKGVQVIFISDSCHSGSLAKSLGSNNRRPTKFVSPKTLGFNTENWRQAAARRGRKSTESFNKLLLVVGSSQDNQFSQAGGPMDMSLFTRIFIKKLDEFASLNKPFTYQSIIDEVKPDVDAASDHEQTPRLDDRFYESSLLNRSIFSFENQGSTAAQAGNLKIAVKVVDEDGNPLSEAFFGILRPGAKTAKGEVLKHDVLMEGKTNLKGVFGSGSQTLPTGSYQIKVVKPGYKAFVKDMNVAEVKDGFAIFVVKLVKE